MYYCAVRCRERISELSNPTSSLSLICKKTALDERIDVTLREGITKTTTYPTFKINVEFVDKKRGTEKKSFTCPHCKKVVHYKAFRREFSLKSSAKWAGLLIGISVLLFLIAMVLFVFGGWDIDPAMWYFGLWGVVGFIFGVGFLLAQTLRYLAFYRDNKYRYFFSISELRSQHVTLDDQKGALWKQLPV